MNIHIVDEQFFNDLKKSSIVSIEIGSSTYGLKNKKSDVDILNIYATSDFELNSLFKSHHQFQYKDITNNIDYMFTNIHTFIRNCIYGDATINFEVINSSNLLNTKLKFLYDFRYYFYNYKIIRSYLGLARRDIKRIDIDGKDEYTKNKKITHAYRSYVFSKKIFNKEEIILNEEEIFEIKNIIWNLNGYKERKEYSNKLLTKIENFRKELNESLNKNEIAEYMLSVNQAEIDNNFFKLINSDYYNSNKLKNINLNYFYDANENGVKY